MSEPIESVPRSADVQPDASGAGIEWIRHDVLLGLEQAGDTIAAAPAPGEPSSLEPATRALRRTRAALALLGNDPWQLLVAESEQLGRALAGGRVRAPEDARALIALALERLTGGLVEDGGPRPIALVPLLDQMRTVQGEPALSELCELPPASMLADHLIGQPWRPPDDGPASAHLAELRARLRAFVLRWHHGELAPPAAAALLEILDGLRQACAGSAAGHMWWAASAMVEAHRDGRLAPWAAVRRLVMRLEPVAKRLADAGPEPERDRRWTRLLQQLLQYVAAADSDGPRAREVRLAFGLDRLFRPPAARAPAPAEPRASDPESLTDGPALARFRSQAADLLAEGESALERWRVAGGPVDGLAPVHDALHDLRLGAQSAGIEAIAELGERIELVLAQALERAVHPPAELVEMVREGLSRMAAQMDVLRSGRRPPRAIDLSAALEAIAELAPPPAAGGEGEADGVRPGPAGLAAGLAAEPELAETTLERLGELASELSASGSGLELQLDSTRHDLAQLDLATTRLRDLLRRLRLELDARQPEAGDPPAPAGAVRDLMHSALETASDLGTIRRALGESERSSGALLRRQRAANTHLHEALMERRTVAFATVAGRLQQVARETAGAGLLISGHNIEFDRGVLHRLVPSLAAVARTLFATAPATPRGHLTFNLVRSGPIVQITASNSARAADTPQPADDGSRRAWIRSRLREDLSKVSLELRMLGGAVEARLHRDATATVVLRVVPSRITSQVVLVSVNAEQIGVLLPYIDGVARISAERARGLLARPGSVCIYRDTRYPVAHLGTLAGIGEPALDNTDRTVSVVMLRAGNSRLAAIVDAIATSHAGPLIPLNAPLDGLINLAGAAITRSGRLAFVLSVEELMSRARTQTAHPAAPVPAEPPAVTVMAVDDSITARTALTDLLGRAGYNVLTARDGLEGLSLLVRTMPDLLLLDVEMPRMGGFEMAERVRRRYSPSELPIIFVTSRSSELTHERAAALGVSRCLVKPWNKSDLLSSIRELVPAAAAATAAAGAA